MIKQQQTIFPVSLRGLDPEELEERLGWTWPRECGRGVALRLLHSRYAVQKKQRKMGLSWDECLFISDSSLYPIYLKLDLSGQKACVCVSILKI